MVKAPYPFKSHFLQIQGLRLHYLDEGVGDPLVMLHGNPTWSYFFRNVVEAVRANYRAIVPDHIGCGLSDKPDDDHYHYTLSRRVDDLEALLDHLNLKENLTLIVHDWGGMIGLAFACRHPKRVRRLVILNTAGFLLPAEKAFPWAIWPFRKTPLGAILVRGFNVFCRGAARWCVARRPLEPTVRTKYLAPYNSWKNRIAVLRFVQDVPIEPTDPTYPLVRDVGAKLKEICQVPTLIAWGMRDFVFDRGFLAEWQKRVPNAEYHFFPTAGHYLLEDAGPEVIKSITDFLSRHPLAR